MNEELKQAKEEAINRHLDRVNKQHAFKHTHKTEEMIDYIEFYTGLLDSIADNYVMYLETRKRKYLNRIKEAQEMLAETAWEALFDVTG